AKPPLAVIFPEPEQSLKSAGMFYLSKIEHDLPMPPRLLNRPLISAIKGELERLFLDKVKFRMVVFQPFIGEILTGKIESSDEACLRLSLGFFNDIYIPEHRIARPCKRGDDGIWVWLYEGEELPLDIGEEVRFRVVNIKYPPVPNEQKEDAKPFAPMEIIGETSGDGLGLPSWWGD
ncbi:DNA-directed RNA polymerase III subunit rpc8, partial [Ananas comosus]